MPGYVEWAPAAVAIGDAGVNPVSQNQFRWVARHPTKKVVRTAVASASTSVKELAQLLFPDIHGNTPWRTHHACQEIDHGYAVNIWDQIYLQWEGFRPFQVTTLSKLEHAMSLETPAIQQFMDGNAVVLNVRSPFSVKAKQIKLHPEMTLSQVAGHYLASTQIATSMICSNGAMIVDPSTCVKHCDTFGTYSFRVYPLLGGVKHENIRTRIKDMLLAKGVPQDKVLDRLNGFASKVPLEKLQHVISEEDEGFWNTTKSLASDARYRLITPAELKVHQQAQRKTKGSGKGKGKKGVSKGEISGKGGSKGKNNGKGKGACKLTDLVIDMQHTLHQTMVMFIVLIWTDLVMIRRGCV